MTHRSLLMLTMMNGMPWLPAAEYPPDDDATATANWPDVHTCGSAFADAGELANEKAIAVRLADNTRAARLRLAK